MTYWRRNVNAQPLTTSGNYWNDAIVPGNTYLRVRIRWGFHLDTPTNVDLAYLGSGLVTFGLCTTYGDGTETPPDPLEVSTDIDPPTLRWIYWESLAPSCKGIDDASGVIIWENSPHSEETQTRGQVLAAGVPPGDTLNLWASWGSTIDWSAQFGANAVIWHSLSILRKFDTP
jgi:hypothetical protein